MSTDSRVRRSQTTDRDEASTLKTGRVRGASIVDDRDVLAAPVSADTRRYRIRSRGAGNGPYGRQSEAAGRVGLWFGCVGFAVPARLTRW